MPVGCVVRRCTSNAHSHTDAIAFHRYYLFLSFAYQVIVDGSMKLSINIKK